MVIMFHNTTIFTVFLVKINKCSLGEHEKLLKTLKYLTDSKPLSGYVVCSYNIITFICF